MSDKEKKYDAEYIRYVESGESAAVFIARDLCNEISTKGKWIDVVDLDIYHKRGGIAFNYFIVELFDRKIKPEYPKDSSQDEKNYITWKTAHMDIERQRKKGIKGPKYIVLCHLYNKNKGTYQKRKVLWNKRFERYVPIGWKTSSCEWREKLVYVSPKKDDWRYKIQAVKRINAKHIKYITKNKNSIIKKIIKNRKPHLEFFYKED
ncbi:MAG: hypothetical protein NC293_09345 [Roseburia sp.]|nr:hypothetical protein [Roseburia sp.]